jgi:hypothetical protein
VDARVVSAGALIASLVVVAGSLLVALGGRSGAARSAATD